MQHKFSLYNYENIKLCPTSLMSNQQSAVTIIHTILSHCDKKRERVHVEDISRKFEHATYGRKIEHLFKLDGSIRDDIYALIKLYAQHSLFFIDRGGFVHPG